MDQCSRGPQSSSLGSKLVQELIQSFDLDGKDLKSRSASHNIMMCINIYIYILIDIVDLQVTWHYDKSDPQVSKKDQVFR